MDYVHNRVVGNSLLSRFTAQGQKPAGSKRHRQSGLQARTVTVFGATGFLGQVIVRHLIRAGCTVRVAARNPGRLDVSKANGSVVQYTADVREDAAVLKAVQGAHAVVNAVGLYTERGEQTFHNIHVNSAERIARAAASAGVESLVHVSGLGASMASKSAYVRARAAGEKKVQQAFPAATILRPSVLFGPDDAFLSALESITKLPLIPLFGDGEVKLQPVHVEDIASAVEKTLLPGCAGVYELGGAQVYSYRDIVQAMLARTGRHGHLLPVPFAVWHVLAAGMAVLPEPPLTSNQVMLMQSDNVVREDVATFADLDLEPRGLDSALPAIAANAG